MYLEALTKLDQISHALVHLMLHDSLLLLHQSIALVRNKVTEGRKRIGRGLPSVISVRVGVHVLFSYLSGTCRGRRRGLLGLFDGRAIWAVH